LTLAQVCFYNTALNVLRLKAMDLVWLKLYSKKFGNFSETMQKNSPENPLPLPKNRNKQKYFTNL